MYTHIRIFMYIHAYKYLHTRPQMPRADLHECIRCLFQKSLNKKSLFKKLTATS